MAYIRFAEIGEAFGRSHGTHGNSVLDAMSTVSNEKMAVCLLCAILNKLDDPVAACDPVMDALRGHRHYLKYWAPRVNQLLKYHSIQVKRISKIFPGVNWGDDMYPCEDGSSVSLAGRSGKHFGGAYPAVYRLRDQVARMRTVRSIKDIRKLHGVGKKREAEILNQLGTRTN